MLTQTVCCTTVEILNFKLTGLLKIKLLLVWYVDINDLNRFCELFVDQGGAVIDNMWLKKDNPYPKFNCHS